MKRLTADQARELMHEELSQASFDEIMDDIYYKIAEMAKRVGIQCSQTKPDTLK